MPVLFAIYVVAFGSYSVAAGPDRNWDLLNYHIYNAFALLHGKLDSDIAPAQLQTFFTPWVDVGIYWLRAALNWQPDLLAMLLALPSAIAALLATCILWRALPETRWERAALVGVGVLFGATGAAGLPTTGTTQSEMVNGAFLLGGVLLLQRQFHFRAQAGWQVAEAGALFGVAAALKLTMAPFCAAAALVYVAIRQGDARSRLVTTGWLLLGGVVGAAAVGGPWWLMMYQRYGNPVFPLLNNLFRSPLYYYRSMSDRNFLPATLWDAVSLPLRWGFQWNHVVGEVTLRDPRFALAGFAAAFLAAGEVLRLWRPRALPWWKPITRAQWFVMAFLMLGFALWEVQFGIFRYLAPLELLTGLLVVLAAMQLPGRRPVRWLALAAVVLLTQRMTFYPQWGRVDGRDVAVSVQMPRLPTNAVVILLHNAPLGFVAAYAPVTVRFIGANNNFVRPGGADGFSRHVAEVIRTASGPLWGLEDTHPTAHIAQANATLAFYHLQRGPGCVAIVTNLEQPANRLQLCPLVRSSAE